MKVDPWTTGDDTWSCHVSRSTSTSPFKREKGEFAWLVRELSCLSICLFFCVFAGFVLSKLIFCFIYVTVIILFCVIPQCFLLRMRREESLWLHISKFDRMPFRHALHTNTIRISIPYSHWTFSTFLVKCFNEGVIPLSESGMCSVINSSAPHPL